MVHLFKLEGGLLNEYVQVTKWFSKPLNEYSLKVFSW